MGVFSMSMLKAATAVVALAGVVNAAADDAAPSFSEPATADDIALVHFSIQPDGANLPEPWC